MTEREKFLKLFDGLSAVKRLENRVEECERALKVLHTWAGVDAALVPEQVRALTSKALHTSTKEMK